MQILILLYLFFLPVLLNGAEIALNVDYPSFQGDFYVFGRLSFPPSAVLSENNMLILDRNTGEETPTKISVIRKWADGSVLSANITFPTNAGRKGDFSVIYGENVRRKKIFTDPAVLPTVAFASAGAPKSSENMDMSVGQINVRVDKSSNIYYYWHILPITLLLIIAFYRTLRAKKARFADEN